jgi:hypothetical protein
MMRSARKCSGLETKETLIIRDTMDIEIPVVLQPGYTTFTLSDVLNKEKLIKIF